MFDSKRFLSIVVHDSEGQRIFWATSIGEYYRQLRAQGIPESGIVTTMDRDGKTQTYTIDQWQNELQDEGEAKAEADAMSTPEPDEPRDLELEANYTKLTEYNRQEWERVMIVVGRLIDERIPF